MEGYIIMGKEKNNYQKMKVEQFKDIPQLNKAIQAIRLSGEWTVGEFARKLQIGSTNSVYDWETGKVRPTFKVFYRMLDLINLSDDDKQDVFKQYQYRSVPKTRRITVYQSHARALVSRYASKEDLEAMLALINSRMLTVSKAQKDAQDSLVNLEELILADKVNYQQLISVRCQLEKILELIDNKVNLPLTLSKASPEVKKTAVSYSYHAKIFITELANDDQLEDLKYRIEKVLAEERGN